jgi:hypothetical protein
MNTTTFLFTFLVIITTRQFGKKISLNLFSELCGVGSWWGIITLDSHKFVKFLGIFYFGRGNLKVYDENVTRLDLAIFKKKIEQVSMTHIYLFLQKKKIGWM